LSEKKFFQTKFIHHKLLSNTDGTKLSKSAGSLSIKTMIAEGFSRKTFYINMAEWLGLNNANKIHDFGELLDVSMEEEII
jgi:glutamyl/glutaminyl-tRNA synthetase